MKYIYRFEFDITDQFDMALPLGARFLHVDIQQRAPHAPSMWWLCDPEREPVTHTFFIVGTGNPMPEGTDASQHMGTFQEMGFVWHLFEKLSVSELFDQEA